MLTTGVVMRRRATTGVDGTRGVGFCFFLGGCSGVGGGFFHRLGSGQPRMPPRERLHEGFDFFGLGNSFTPTGATRPRPAAGQASINALFVFAVLWGALLPFVLRACCGGMCWPRERPATHAAAGAAARGALIFCFGDSFTRSGVVRHACRHRVTARGVFGLGGLFHTPWSDATRIDALFWVLHEGFLCWRGGAMGVVFLAGQYLNAHLC